MITRPYKVLTADDVKAIQMWQLPLVVLSDNLGGGFWGWFCQRVKQHTKGDYGHVMVMHRPGYVATQDWTFREEPLEKWLTPHHRLKFVHMDDWDGRTRIQLLDNVKKQLARKTRYDIIGIFGQALRWSGLQINWLNYCSESVAEMLAIVEPYFKRHPHVSPSDIDRYFNFEPSAWCYGVYDPCRKEDNM